VGVVFAGWSCQVVCVVRDDWAVRSGGDQVADGIRPISCLIAGIGSTRMFFSRHDATPEKAEKDPPRAIWV
jgi:hypothetical protein